MDKMITEDYVSLETAKLLKEKGFDGVCNVWYSEYTSQFFSGKKYTSIEFDDHNRFDDNYKFICYAPTIQMVIKWIRMKGFHIFVPLEIDYDEDERGDKWYHDVTYYPEIRRVSDGKIMYDDGALYATPEQAYEVAIRYYLENLL